MNSRTICLWGDSLGKGVFFDESRGRYAILRENCLRLLAQALPVQVFNYSVMGRTAPECLAAADPGDLKPGGIAVLEFGGNDSDMDWALVAREPDREHSPRASIAQFKQGLRGMIAFARAGEMEPMVVSPLPIDGEKYFRWVSQGLDGQAILSYLGGDAHMMYRWQEQYACAARDVAAEEQVRFLDFRSALLADRQFRGLYCRDGIHLNAQGHRKLFDCAMGMIQKSA